LADLQQQIGVAMGCGCCRDAVCEEISNYYGSKVRCDFSTRVAQPT
jgi:bacterioferritin-associated ferredoxin